MTEDIKRKRLETKALVIGYAMSRLDLSYLSRRGVSSWRQAYAEASAALGEVATTFKNLRDEFDPFHTNPRRGWHMRPLRIGRQNVLEELKDISDDALMELVQRIVSNQEEATAEAIDSLARVHKVAANVAERLLTGRRAEEYFLANALRIANVAPERLRDCRLDAAGYDFGVADAPETAIEVKGIKTVQGSILFTDREWVEAKKRGGQYWLVIVGNLLVKPQAKMILNPYANLTVSSAYQQSISVTWRSSVSVR
jgi:hypothetical protein